MAKIVEFFDVLPHGGGKQRRIKLIGRFAWTLRQLIEAGRKGITSLERPAPRLSHYIYILRRDHGLAIETRPEQHDGPYPGRHGRYILLDNAVPVALSGAREAA